jgi:molybdenum cofactor cytidylyltransferase
MPEPGCTVLILAAGAATRMGQAKQNLSWQGKTMLQHCVETCMEAALGPVKVVLGANIELISPTLLAYPMVGLIENKNWQTGMASSIKLGIAECSGADYVMLVAADQVHLDAVFLQKLFAETWAAKAIIGAACYEGVLGIPAVFSKAFFPELMQLEGEQGARKMLMEYQSAALSLPCPAAAIDLDTKEDWARFMQDKSLTT